MAEKREGPAGSGKARRVFAFALLSLAVLGGLSTLGLAAIPWWIFGGLTVAAALQYALSRVPPGRRSSLPGQVANGLALALGIAGGLVALSFIAPVVGHFLWHATHEVDTSETATIATLRNFLSVQARLREEALIDVDGDGVGEYGTLLEMTRLAGLRRGSGGARPGTAVLGAGGVPLTEPLLYARGGEALESLRETGTLTRFGFHFVLYLPDGGTPPAAVRERMVEGVPGLEGGTRTLGIDASENWWCAYAWPEEGNAPGHRVFFVDEKGDILRCSNRAAGYVGAESPPPYDAAFRPGPPSAWGGPLAVGTVGRDGELWKIVN